MIQTMQTEVSDVEREILIALLWARKFLETQGRWPLWEEIKAARDAAKTRD